MTHKYNFDPSWSRRVFATTIGLPKQTKGALRQRIGVALGLKAVFAVPPMVGLRRAPLADAGAPAPVAIRAPPRLSPVKTA